MTSPSAPDGADRKPAHTDEDPLDVFPSEHQPTNVRLRAPFRQFIPWCIATAAAAAAAVRHARTAPFGLRAFAGGEAVASRYRLLAQQIAARKSLPTIVVASFAFGAVVGGSVVWLSGAPGEGNTAAIAPISEAPRAIEPPVAPVRAAASAIASPTVESKTAAPTVAARRRRPVFRGSLVVESRPSGARVFLNGRSVGMTPLVLTNQAAGSRAVRVALDGYESWSSAVRVVANSRTRLRAELKAQSPPAQP